MMTAELKINLIIKALIRAFRMAIALLEKAREGEDF